MLVGWSIGVLCGALLLVFVVASLGAALLSVDSSLASEGMDYREQTTTAGAPAP
jgi:hypothetical protein